MTPHKESDPTEWFWFPDKGWLWVWSPETPSRSRFWILQGTNPVAESLGELPATSRPGGQLLSLPRLGTAWTAVFGRMPDGPGIGFAQGQALQPCLFRDGGIVLRWEPGSWHSVRVAGLSISGCEARLWPTRIVPAGARSFTIPLEWLGSSPLELLVTPVASDNRRGATETVVLAGQPPEGHVCFEHVRDPGPRGSHWLRVRVSAVGDVPFTVDLRTESSVGSPPQPVQLLANSAAFPTAQEFRDVITTDRIRAVVQSRSPELVCRFFLTGLDGVQREIQAEDATPQACSYTFPDQAPLRSCRSEERIAPSGFSDLINELLRSPVLAGLGEAGLSTCPGGVLLALSEIATVPEPWCEVAEALGTQPTELAADFLRRPQEYALLRDPAIREFFRLAGGAEQIRSVPELILSRANGLSAVSLPPPSPPLTYREQLVPRPVGVANEPSRSSSRPSGFREYLLRAEDADLNAWMAGLAAGLGPDVLFELLAVRRWRCPPTELAELASALQQLQSDPLSILLRELLPTSENPLWCEIDAAVRAESAALRSGTQSMSVRTAREGRNRALESAAAQLQRVAGATRGDAVAPVLACLRQGHAGAAARLLADLRGSQDAPPAGEPARGMLFRIEVDWAVETVRQAEARRKAELTAAAWALDLLHRQEVPSWPYAGSIERTSILPDLLAAEWQRWQRKIPRMTPLPPELCGQLPANLAKRLAEVQTAVPEGPVRRVLKDLERSAGTLSGWLEIPSAQQRLRQLVAEITAQIQTGEAIRLTSGPRNAIEAALCGSRPDWIAGLAALQHLQEIHADEVAWLRAERALRDAGLPPAHIRTGDLGALEAWLRCDTELPPPPDLQTLDSFLRAANLPLDDGANELTGEQPSVRHLFPDQYVTAMKLLAGVRHRATVRRTDAQRREAFRAWWAKGFEVTDPAGIVRWLLAEEQRDRVRQRAAVLSRLPCLWDDLRWLFLDGFTLVPSLAALLRYRSVVTWLRPANSRRLAASLQKLLVRAGNIEQLLDNPEEVSNLTALASRLRLEVGLDRLVLTDLRDYLCESLSWQLRASGREPAAMDLEAELRRLCCGESAEEANGEQIAG